MFSNAKRPLRIACIGECMIELSDLAAADGRARLGVAGDTFNTAVYLARLLPRATAEVSFVTALGPDRFSARILHTMEAEGINTRLVARINDKLPGLYAIELDAAGERSFRYWRKDSAARSMFQSGGVDLGALDGFDLIYLSGITLAILPELDRARLLSKLAALAAAGCTVAFDGNYRPALWGCPEEARQAMAGASRIAAIVMPSFDDEIALDGAATLDGVLQALSAAGAREVVLKRAEAGPILWADGAMISGSYPPAETVVDTTAAGDAFNAGYLAARIVGRGPAEAAQIGHALAVQVIGQNGAIVETALSL